MTESGVVTRRKQLNESPRLAFQAKIECRGVYEVRSPVFLLKIAMTLVSADSHDKLEH